MAGIDVRSRSDGRELNHELPLVPFIDFLLCLVAFLLVTAVWSLSARMAADAQVPGPLGTEATAARRLHVEVRRDTFHLVWRLGSTVIDTVDVPRHPVRNRDGDVRYPELARTIAEVWRSGGSHKAPTDLRQDEAVLHTGDALEFGEIVGVLDAFAATERSAASRDVTTSIPAFRVSFAVD